MRNRFHPREDLGAAEDAEDDVVELLGRAQEEAPLDGAAGDLDEAPALGHEAEMAAHAHKKSENDVPFFHLVPKFLRADDISSHQRVQGGPRGGAVLQYLGGTERGGSLGVTLLREGRA
jgi:hypothetical protein